MPSRIRTIATAMAATGLVAVALIGCSPSASPVESMDDGLESVPAESMVESMAEPSASPSE
jgi:hypothetical protein